MRTSKVEEFVAYPPRNGTIHKTFRVFKVTCDEKLVNVFSDRKRAVDYMIHNKKPGEHWEVDQ